MLAPHVPLLRFTALIWMVPWLLCFLTTCGRKTGGGFLATGVGRHSLECLFNRICWALFGFFCLTTIGTCWSRGARLSGDSPPPQHRASRLVRSLVSSPSDIRTDWRMMPTGCSPGLDETRRGRESHFRFSDGLFMIPAMRASIQGQRLAVNRGALVGCHRQSTGHSSVLRAFEKVGIWTGRKFCRQPCRNRCAAAVGLLIT